MRSKGHASDYRYLPEPDLTPLIVTSGDRDRAANALVALPLDDWLIRQDNTRRETLITAHKLDEYVASVLMKNEALLSFFERCVEAGGESREMANWAQGEITRHINEGYALNKAKLTPSTSSKFSSLSTRVPFPIVEPSKFWEPSGAMAGTQRRLFNAFNSLPFKMSPNFARLSAIRYGIIRNKCRNI